MAQSLPSGLKLFESTDSVNKEAFNENTKLINDSLITRAPLASPSFNGIPTAPTAPADTNTVQLATTAFVLGQAGGNLPIMNGSAASGVSTKYARQDHQHPTDMTRASVSSPAFTGIPSAPTAAQGTNTTQIATTAFVRNEITAKQQFVTPSDNVLYTYGGGGFSGQQRSFTVPYQGRYRIKGMAQRGSQTEYISINIFRTPVSIGSFLITSREVFAPYSIDMVIAVPAQSVISISVGGYGSIDTNGIQICGTVGTSYVGGFAEV
ncbi:hypothetical protein [Paenibacillus sp. NPDC058174]|uniref:hypothetical protein n=1 Tax=Paenibacillus sp. NPDC058174 TaxID=3346366 RepID=UPI0036DAFBC0